MSVRYVPHLRLRVREGRLQPGRRTFAPAPLVPPDPPSLLVCTTFSSSRIDLAWMDNSTNEDGFKIERGPTLLGPFAQIDTVGPGVTTYMDMGLAASTAFCYRVRAFNAAGDSAYSNVDCCTTDPAPPGAGEAEPGPYLKRYLGRRTFAGRRLGDWLG